MRAPFSWCQLLADRRLSCRGAAGYWGGRGLRSLAEEGNWERDGGGGGGGGGWGNYRVMQIQDRWVYRRWGGGGGGGGGVYKIYVGGGTEDWGGTEGAKETMGGPD